MIRTSLKDELIQSATSNGVEAQLDLILSEARECAYFMNRCSTVQEDGTIGGSHLGGLPDLPTDVEWPSGMDHAGNREGHAQFLGQFNLEDIPPFNDSPLPQKGFLWLFSRRWGGDCFDIPLVAIYQSKEVHLERRARPVAGGDEHPSLPTVPIDFEVGVSLPIFRKSFCIAMRDKAVSNLLGVSKKINRERVGQIGGYSVEKEYDFYRWIAFSKMGVQDYYEADKFESISEYELALKNMAHNRKRFCHQKGVDLVFPVEKMALIRPKVEWIDQHRVEIGSEAASWRLLLSLWDNMQVDFDIGDAMSLDIFIRSSHLQSMKFDNLIGEMPQVL